MNATIFPSQLKGTVKLPSSKSLVHRHLIASFLAGEKREIPVRGLSQDILHTMKGLYALGGDFSIKDEKIFFRGRRTPSEEGEIFCGESASTLRFLIPLAGALGLKRVFVMEDSLARRPLKLYEKLLPAHGIKLQRDGNRLEISGKLTGGNFCLDGSESSQWVTGLLMSLPLLQENSEIVVENPSSQNYIDLTLELLGDCGIAIRRAENKYEILGGQAYRSPTQTVAEDASQACFWFLAGLLGHDIRLSPWGEDAQADRKALKVFETMGLRLKREEKTLRLLSPRVIRPVKVFGDEFPDGIPPLVLGAAFAKGQSRFQKLHRLRIKESDRLETLVKGLQNLKVKADIQKEGIILQGGGLSGGLVHTQKDHRMVMAFAIGATKATGSVSLSDGESVKKSYPDFWRDFQAMGGKVIFHEEKVKESKVLNL